MIFILFWRLIEFIWSYSRKNQKQTFYNTSIEIYNICYKFHALTPRNYGNKGYNDSMNKNENEKINLRMRLNVLMRMTLRIKIWRMINWVLCIKGKINNTTRWIRENENDEEKKNDRYNKNKNVIIDNKNKNKIN